jgi:cytochrome c oxidase subunit II
VRRGSVVWVVLIGAVMGGIAVAFALAFTWLPSAASREAGRIHFIFWFVTGICIFIFALVSAVVLYAVFKFRSKPDDDSDGPPVHGHTGLEIAWTVVPTLLVTAIAIASGIVLAKNGDAGNKPLHVEVTGQQFAWSFTYPDAGGLTTGTLRLPEGRSVKLTLKALDVIHSFWVPEFSQKQDLVPGIVTSIVITPDKLGTFPVVCTELCGLGHALMRSSVTVMPAAEFDAWLASQQKALSGAGAGGAAAAGKAVFENNGCGACHALKAAGSTAKVGPDLDNLPAEAKKAGQPLDAFVRDSIVNPNAYIEPGYPKNLMPQTFKTLPKQQLDDLVTFLIDSSKGTG